MVPTPMKPICLSMMRFLPKWSAAARRLL